MIRKTLVPVIVIALMIQSAAVIAQDANKEVDEIWFGTLVAGPTKLRLEFRINKDENGKYSGKMISLDQGDAEVPCDTVTRTDTELSFSIKVAFAKYDGKLNADQTEAVGTFEQGGAKIPLSLKKVDKVPARNHTQTWTGKMKAGPQEFDFQFRVFEDEDREITVLLDSFTENLSDIPCTMEHDAETITINVPIAAAPAEYVGTLSEDHKTVTGNWTQRGNSFDLILKSIPVQSTRKLEQKRPQTPKPPFDYDSEDLKIQNKKDNLTLAATLTTPKGNGPFPVVITISGSGPQDRDETLFGHKPFLVIADHLAKNGIATLRFDDRGTAESTGDFGSATSEDFSHDIDAIVEFVKKHKKIDPNKIALLGHSEGGIIAPMIASRRDDIAAIVMLAGPGVDGRKISMNQSRLIMEATGVPEYMIKVQETMLNGLYEHQENGGTADDDDALNALAEKMKAQMPEDMRDSLDGRMMIAPAWKQLNTPWFSFFAKYDPAPALKKIRCPVLAIVGARDTQVDPKLNMPVIEEALQEGGNPDYQLEVLPNLNHLFQNCQTGAVAEYARIEETMDLGALALVSDWLAKRLK